MNDILLLSFQIPNKEPVCYEKINDFNSIRTSVKYWVEGVSILIFGNIGIVANMLSMLIFHRIKSNKRFYTLLIA